MQTSTTYRFWKLEVQSSKNPTEALGKAKEEGLCTPTYITLSSWV